MRQMACNHVRILSEGQCGDSNARQKAADWHLIFSQKLANTRVGVLDRAVHSDGLNVIYFPDCSETVLGTDGIIIILIIIINGLLHIAAQMLDCTRNIKTRTHTVQSHRAPVTHNIVYN